MTAATASFRTALTALFGLRHPIILAPMGAIAGGALAAAVTRAGGLGLIGPGYLGEDWIDREFDAAGDTPVGVGFITWDLAKSPQRLAAALARKPSAAMLSFGDAAPFVDAVKSSGARLILQVQTVAAAKQAAQLGADVIVAQGIEGGGHGAHPGAGRSLMPLVPAVVDAVAPVPVVAAGGIADGRGLAAALVLGAAGVLAGTRFYAASESLGHVNAKARIVAASGDTTLRTRVFDLARAIDWPVEYTGRALANDLSSRWHGHEDELERSLASERARYAAAALAGDVNTAVVWAGEGVDLMQAVEPATAIIERMVAEARATLDRTASLRL
jgi:nitronate monooxygenase